MQSAVHSLNWYLTLARRTELEKNDVSAFTTSVNQQTSSISGKVLEKSSVRASVIIGKLDQISCLTVIWILGLSFVDVGRRMRVSRAWLLRLTAIAFPWCARDWVGSCETSVTFHPQARWLRVGCWSPPEQDFFGTDWGRSLDLSWAGWMSIRVDDRGHLAFLTVPHRQRSGGRTWGSSTASFNPTVQLKEGTLWWAVRATCSGLSSRPFSFVPWKHRRNA